jgi:hypothetical protein
VQPGQNELFVLPWLYLDPGSGSFIIQLLIAALLGASVAIRLYWTRIKGILPGKKSPSEDNAEDPDAK